MIALFFGTFNPIHIGHLIIANYFAEQPNIEKVWLVVTPHNPLKKKSSLLADEHRLYLTRLAVENNPKLHVSNVEFGLPQPSYTASTLAHLSDIYPDKKFVLIMGEDNLRSFYKWKNYKEILEHNHIHVYSRNTIEPSSIPTEFINHPSITLHKNVPLMHISSTYIRKHIAEGKNPQYMLSPPVLNYIEEMGFYKK